MDIVTIAGSVWYRPNVKTAEGNNRELGEKALVVLIDPMTARELRLVEAPVIETTIDPAQKLTEDNWMEKYHAIRDAVLVRCIKDIRNCTHTMVTDGEARSESVTTADRFVRLASDPWLDDIFAAIKNQSILCEEILKKSEPPSDISSAPQMQSADGGAVSATPTLTLSARQTQAQPILNYVTPTPKKDASEIARVRQIQASAYPGSQS